MSNELNALSRDTRSSSDSRDMSRRLSRWPTASRRVVVGIKARVDARVALPVNIDDLARAGHRLCSTPL